MSKKIHSQLVPIAAVLRVVGRVHQEAQRHLEHRVDLVLVDVELKARPDDAEDRRDAEAAAGDIIRHPADDLDLVRPNADFLLRLAQRGELRGRVGVVDAPARKGHLPGMAAQRFGALGQDDGRLVGMIDDRDQHRGVAQLDLPQVVQARMAGIPAMVAIVAMLVDASPTRATRAAQIVCGENGADDLASITRSAASACRPA